ncbi:hypothetical protein [Parasitella parasitica]|uniref:Uncharacterized protein n=1 Tax=Parasitella parasitica TaxID=35722 RepID=A0A0B7NMX6_9FUNG|nr:hypothetical protein [Parasitella parasitica]
MEMDENDDQDDDVQSSLPKRNPRAVQRTADTAKKAFLKLLLRLRRVILQMLAEAPLLTFTPCSLALVLGSMNL